jgi:OOP family OmpA-OmpF porin
VGILKERPDLKVVIEGHTCNIGTDAYNQKLSERRAQSVHDYLVRNGVSSTKLSTVGRGETQPMADNKTKSGRELNRRVEFQVME